MQVVGEAVEHNPMFSLLVQRGDDHADARSAFAAAIGAHVGRGPPGGERLHLDQGHSPDLAGHRRRGLEQVEGPRQQAHRNPDRAEGLEQVEQAFVVRLRCSDHDSVRAVAFDDVEGRHPLARIGGVVGGRQGGNQLGVVPQRLIGPQPLRRSLVSDQDPALGLVEAPPQRLHGRQGSAVEEQEPRAKRQLRAGAEVGQKRRRPGEKDGSQEPDSHAGDLLVGARGFPRPPCAIGVQSRVDDQKHEWGNRQRREQLRTAGEDDGGDGDRGRGQVNRGKLARGPVHSRTRAGFPASAGPGPGRCAGGCGPGPVPVPLQLTLCVVASGRDSSVEIGRSLPLSAPTGGAL